MFQQFKDILNVSLSVVFIMVSGSAYCQRYTITPNDTINMAGGMEDQATLSIEQFNQTTDTILLKWKKISAFVPDKWEAAVCDNQMCQATLTDSGTMNPVFPGENGLLLLHITPHVNYGTAIVRYAVWDTGKASEIDTLTYILVVKETSGTYQNLSMKGTRIYPNPARDNFIIYSTSKPGFNFSITDILGKELYSGFSNGNSISIPTSHLPSGVYNITMIDSDRIKSLSKIIIQH